MGAYLQNYGAGEDRRNSIIKRIVLISLAIIVVACTLFFILHNYPEKQLVKHFLTEVNDKQYKNAYKTWNCAASGTCRDYDYQRFVQDWGPSKNISSPWKIASVDGCTAFVTINVQAGGAELQSLSVNRGSNGIGYAPSPECMEKKIRLGRFFHRLFNGNSAPPPQSRQ